MRRRRQGLQVNTFPFLAVLLCAMGSLILILLAIDRRAKVTARARAREALVQKSAEKTALKTAQRAAERARAEATAREEWERRRRELHALLVAEQEQLNGQVRQASARVEEAAAHAQVEADMTTHLRDMLRTERDRLAARTQEIETQQSEAAQAAGQTQQAREQLARLTRDLQDMERTLADLKAARLREQKTYSLVPYRGRQGESRRPIYIECTSRGLLFHPDKLSLDGNASTTDQVRTEVANRITRQGAHADGKPPYLLLLVRPDGITTYYSTLHALDGIDFDFGYEFVDREWILDFPETDEAVPTQSWMVADKGPRPPPPEIKPRPSSVPRAQAAGGVWPSLGPGSGRGTGGIGPIQGQPGVLAEGAPRGSGAGAPGGLAMGGPGSGSGLPLEKRTTSGGLFPSGSNEGTPGSGSTGLGGGGSGPGLPISPGVGKPGGSGLAAGPGGNGSGTGGPTLGGGTTPDFTQGNSVGSIPGGQGNGLRLPGARPGNGGTVAGRGPGTGTGASPSQTTPAGMISNQGGSGMGAYGPGLRLPPGTEGAVSAGYPPSSGGTAQSGPGSGQVLGQGATSAGMSAGLGTPVPGAGAASGGPAGNSEPGAGGNDGYASSSGTSGSPGAGGSGGGKALTSDGTTGSAGQAQASGSSGQGVDSFPSGEAPPGLRPQAPALASDPNAAPAPRLPSNPPPRTERSAGPPPARLVGNRDWIIQIECTADGIVLLPSRLKIPTANLSPGGPGEKLLQTSIQQMIDRRQASVRPGEPPYRPQIRFLTHANGLRAYYLGFPLVQPLGLPMTRQRIEIEDESGPGSSVP